MKSVPAKATNQSKSTKPRPYFVLTRNAPEVVAILATGESYGEVARLYECDPAAVMRFANKHRAVITGLAAEVERQVSDYAIAQKVNRIAGLDALAGKVQEWIDDRGLMERSVMTTKDGTTIERERFAREVAAELRAIYHAAAEEMGQLPKNDTNVQVNVATLVRYVQGPG